MESQFKKGVLELCVLALLENSDYYGYELVSRLSKEISITEGTIYPLLRRLKIDGLVTTYLEESSGGPARKYYKLTIEGKQKLKSHRKEWDSFALKVNKFLKGVKK
jgi:PadR family transcriptional regulator PadR